MAWQQIAVILAGLLCCGTTALAENAEPEKCTCDIVPSDPQENGASVTNATACWSSEDHQRQWCDITIQSIEGEQTHTAIVGQLFEYQDNSEALIDIFSQELKKFIASASSGAASGHIDWQHVSVVIPELMKAKEEKISECVTAFRDRNFGKPGYSSAPDEEFRCNVGAASGWLRIEFRVNDSHWIAYMLAPPEQR